MLLTPFRTIASADGGGSGGGVPGGEGGAGGGDGGGSPFHSEVTKAVGWVWKVTVSSPPLLCRRLR